MKPHYVPVSTLDHLGSVLKATRKYQRLRQDEVGGLSHSFIGEVESGKPTAQIGKVLELARELGVRLYLELPRGVTLGDEGAQPRSR